MTSSFVAYDKVEIVYDEHQHGNRFEAYRRRGATVQNGTFDLLHTSGLHGEVRAWVEALDDPSTFIVARF